MARRSRLSRKSQKKSTRTLILSVLGIAAILFLLFRYGIPLLSDARFLFGRVTSSPNDENKKKEDENFVPIPDLDSIPRATKEQNIKVTGISLPRLTVKLYVNGGLEEEAEAGENGSFEFDVELSEGENIIK